MNQIITDNQRWISKKYLAYEALTSFWCISAIWLYFYRIFITDQQVGVLDGLAFAIGLLAEVPSGVLADRFGRDKMVRLGQILAGIGFLIQALGSGFMPFFIGQAVLMVGVSFVSGADEALFFNRLNFSRTSTQWRKLVTRGSQFALISSLIATISGGLLFIINPRIPWILTGLTCIGSAILVWSVKDVRPGRILQKFSIELREYLIGIKMGFSQFYTQNLRSYVPIIIIVQGLFYTAGWGLLRPVLLDRFHFGPFPASVVIATSCLITVGILAIMHKYAENMSEGRVITFISITAGAGLLLSLGNIGMWGYIVILILYAGEHVLYPFMSEVLNNRSTEAHRATVLSVASFLRTIPYIALAPLIGYLNTHDHLGYFLSGWTLLICVAIMLYLILKKSDMHVSMVQKGINLEERIPDISVD